MSGATDKFAEKWGAPTFAGSVPPERYDQFGNLVPELLLTFWREFGFAGFGDGLFWICDPVAWQPAVDAWTRDLGLAMGDDRWLAVCRSAFGEMKLWGQRTGMSLKIIPHRGWVRPTDRSQRMGSSAARDRQIHAAMIAPEKRSLDVLGDDGRPLFDQVLALKGPVGPDTVYGFVPALALGGSLRADRVEIFDAEVHLQLLSDITPRQIMGDVTQARLWRPVRVNQTGLQGKTAKLLTDDPTDDAGFPADLPAGTSEVLIVDDQPNPTLTVRVHPVGDSSRLTYVRFDQLAVRD